MIALSKEAELYNGEGSQGVLSARPPVHRGVDLLACPFSCWPDSFPKGRGPDTAAVSSCILSSTLSRALKLQLPGICSLWLIQRKELFEKQIPELWTIIKEP